VLGIPDERFIEPSAALDQAISGSPVIFVDDFVGSGDQFLSTWSRVYRSAVPRNFLEAHQSTPFIAIYVTLVATDFGLARIRSVATQIAITSAHVLDESSTVRGLTSHPSFSIPDLATAIKDFLEKYSPKLQPPDFIAKQESWVRNGYKDRGLLFAFEHSVPDATLPIFWSPGDRVWNSLLERR
jgi:hypothetical protein